MAHLRRQVVGGATPCSHSGVRTLCCMARSTAQRSKAQHSTAWHSPWPLRCVAPATIIVASPNCMAAQQQFEKVPACLPACVRAWRSSMLEVQLQAHTGQAGHCGCSTTRAGRLGLSMLLKALPALAGGAAAPTSASLATASQGEARSRLSKMLPGCRQAGRQGRCMAGMWLATKGRSGKEQAPEQLCMGMWCLTGHLSNWFQV
jgi:hypothetical protein